MLDKTINDAGQLSAQNVGNNDGTVWYRLLNLNICELGVHETRERIIPKLNPEGNE